MQQWNIFRICFHAKIAEVYTWLNNPLFGIILTRIPKENHWLSTTNCQTESHTVIKSSTSRHWQELTWWQWDYMSRCWYKYSMIRTNAGITTKRKNVSIKFSLPAKQTGSFSTKQGGLTPKWKKSSKVRNQNLLSFYGSLPCV